MWISLFVFLGKLGQWKEQWNRVRENWFPAKSLLSPIRPGSNDTHTPLSELTLNSAPLLFCLTSLSLSNTVTCISCVTWHYTFSANFQIIFFIINCHLKQSFEWKISNAVWHKMKRELHHCHFTKKEKKKISLQLNTYQMIMDLFYHLNN